MPIEKDGIMYKMDKEKWTQMKRQNEHQIELNYNGEFVLVWTKLRNRDGK